MTLSPALAASLPAHTLVAVEGKTTDGNFFSFDMIHFDDESEFDLVDRALLAFQTYSIGVAEYKINI